VFNNLVVFFGGHLVSGLKTQFQSICLENKDLKREVTQQNEIITSLGTELTESLEIQSKEQSWNRRHWRICHRWRIRKCSYYHLCFTRNWP